MENWSVGTLLAVFIIAMVVLLIADDHRRAHLRERLTKPPGRHRPRYVIHHRH